MTTEEWNSLPVTTADAFNEKYSEWLAEGHYGMSWDDRKVLDYLDERFQEFIKVEGFKYSQIKVKFGMCRFYEDGLDRETQMGVESDINTIMAESEDKW